MRNADATGRPVGGHGFTLTELMVVTVLVAIVAVVMLPAISHASAGARDVSCRGILKRFGDAMHLYADSQDNMFPPHRRLGYERPWFGHLAYREQLGIDSNWWSLPDELLCPARPPGLPNEAWRVYGENATNLPVVQEPEGEAVYVNRSLVSHPQDKVQLIDANDYHVLWWGADARYKWDVSGEKRMLEGGSDQIVTYRHNETANVLHFDGGVANRTKDRLFPIASDAAGQIDPELTRRVWWVYE